MNFDETWTKFMEARSKPLNERFPGQYRSLIVETNDPLNMGRVRFRCPDNILTGQFTPDLPIRLKEDYMLYRRSIAQRARAMT